MRSATLIAKEIKRRIQSELNLTASAGVSINKFLAKVASDFDKPNGLYVVNPDEAVAFIEKLEIERFFGIGKVTATKMHRFGIHTGADLKRWALSDLLRVLGKNGGFLYQIARGIDLRPVCPDKERKSYGAENTFATDLFLREDIFREIEKLAQEVMRRLKKQKRYGKRLTIKVKYADFTQITRCRSGELGIDTASLIANVAKKMFDSIDTKGKPIRLLGLSISSFDAPGVVQLPLFDR